MSSKNVFLVFFSFFLVFSAQLNHILAQTNIAQNLDILHLQNSTSKSKKVAPKNLILHFYQNHISSQDGSGCQFYPSCSQYAINVIKNKGILWGIIMITDRLNRCNPYEQQFYLYSEEHLKHIDYGR